MDHVFDPDALNRYGSTQIGHSHPHTHTPTDPVHPVHLQSDHNHQGHIHVRYANHDRPAVDHHHINPADPLQHQAGPDHA